MKNSTIYVKSLYNNKSVLHAKNFSIIVTILIFLSIVVLTSSPFYLSKMSIKDEQLLSVIDGFDDSFKEFLAMEYDCKIEDYILACNEIIEDKQYGDYTYVFLPKEELDFTQNTVIFYEQKVDIFGNNPNALISGNYQLVDGLDFNTISDLKPDDLTKEEYYNNLSIWFLRNVYLSTIMYDVQIIFVTQFMQLLTYMLVVAGLFLFANKKSSNYKNTYLDNLKIIITAGLAPAIITALIGLYKPSIATTIFTIIYAVRLVFVYMTKIKEK